MREEREGETKVRKKRIVKDERVRRGRKGRGTNIRRKERGGVRRLKREGEKRKGR